MEKKRRKLIFGAAPIIFLLIVVPFIFDGIIVPFHKLIGIESSRELNKAHEEQRQFKSLFTKLLRAKDRRKLETTGFACDIAENSIVCVSNEQVRIDTRNNITVHSSSSLPTYKEKQEIQSVKPYALQKDKYLLQFISPVKILHGTAEPPACRSNHVDPAVIFSSGISRNVFHEFNDIIIPLFITVSHFKSRVQLVLEDYDPVFVNKFSKILSRLSNHEVMNPAANRTVHCFPGMILGLKYHDNLALNPSDIPGGYTMKGFRQFLRSTYNLAFTHVSQIRKPKLLLISREKTRKFLNEDEMIDMMEGLGFDVVVARTKNASNINEFSHTINSCSVLVGVHGAGLTNELFLPDGAVMVQVEPLGLEWASANYFGNPAREMEVKYLRYKIEPEESSLLQLYGRDHAFIVDPTVVYAKGYRMVKTVYLQQQNIRVHIAKFRETLEQALRFVRN